MEISTVSGSNSVTNFSSEENMLEGPEMGNMTPQPGQSAILTDGQLPMNDQSAQSGAGNQVDLFA
ncbi:MAG: hypothetical protein ACLFN5_02035 [bacterium]